MSRLQICPTLIFRLRHKWHPVLGFPPYTIFVYLIGAQLGDKICSGSDIDEDKFLKCFVKRIYQMLDGVVAAGALRDRHKEP